jgi:hypothetical protein
MPSGKLLTMSIARTNTTAFIKSKIQELKNIPVDEQHLYYLKKELQDGFTLSESNIKNESVLVFERTKRYLRHNRTVTGTTPTFQICVLIGQQRKSI